ncbi:hypothetical protein ACSBL2_14185 [Pedobacter sp. AW31-3R]|uniref:hypothetical protein n=1 Tax=Pedobacter sp. AW31-3R TaxID=3445781 RepID=UPI003FA0A9B1
MRLTIQCVSSMLIEYIIYADDAQELSEVIIRAQRPPEVPMSFNIFSLDVFGRSIGSSRNYDAGQLLVPTNQNIASVNTEGGKKNQNESDDNKKLSLEDIKNPPLESVAYKPSKSGARKARSSRGTGWVDKSGYIWVPDDHGGTHVSH